MNALEQGRALAGRLGDPGAFFTVDRARREGSTAHVPEVETPEDLPTVDRYLEGRLTGIAAVPAAAAWEAAKPLVKAIPEPFQKFLPEGFRYQPGVTSEPSMEHVTATAQGALDSGRIIPYHVRALVGSGLSGISSGLSAARQALALRGR